MKIGEIKRQTLIMIFPEIEASLNEESKESLKDLFIRLRCDPSLKSYIDACIPAINRAICLGEIYGALPKGSPRISEITAEDKELDLPREISEIMPYFIKAEITRGDDPEASFNEEKRYISLISRMGQQSEAVYTVYSLSEV